MWSFVACVFVNVQTFLIDYFCGWCRKWCFNLYLWIIKTLSVETLFIDQNDVDSLGSWLNNSSYVSF